ncbi:MAG TPA: NAD-dependent malic enzyme [Blastocatellia bacterium]|nr:NAD-dependent malic enzyme [Blastocatellia bacterium]
MRPVQLEGSDDHSERNDSERTIEISLTGKSLLEDPLLNKGSAFNEQERLEFGLLGLLPPHVSTVEEQLERTYYNFCQKPNELEKYIFLISLQDRNETLFYRLLLEHIEEMTPVIYTPVVGLGCQEYSRIYRRPRGLYISFPRRNEIPAMLANAPSKEVDVIVVTDGERVLGLGDLGIGGMGIPVGKLSLYTACAGIAPDRTLPITLDAGTNNKELLTDPLYLGWRHERITGVQYDDFIELFVQAIAARFPSALLQWEDFAMNNARRLLQRYRDRLCTFNDDIQGTGAVTLAGIMAAAKLAGSSLPALQIAILGAGSAGVGISDQIVAGMVHAGLSEAEAASRIWLTDINGLLSDARADLEAFQRKYAKPVDRMAGWTLQESDRVSLIDVIRNVHPSVLIGVSAHPNAFDMRLIRTMADYCDRPIIFPLSNPTSRSEAAPRDLIEWTDGRALVATGSPFTPVIYGGRTIHVGQCNNALIFPGLGLGIIASRARRVTDTMFAAAANALAEASPALLDSHQPLYPGLAQSRQISQRVAMAVALQAQHEGLAEAFAENELPHRIATAMWTPSYCRYRRVPDYTSTLR